MSTGSGYQIEQKSFYQKLKINKVSWNCTIVDYSKLDQYVMTLSKNNIFCNDLS